MNCKLENREDLISKYLMNELSDEDSLKFEEHYFKCADCFNELKAADNALNLIKKEGFAVLEKESSKSFIDMIFSGFKNPARLGIAFASLAVIFLFFYVFYNINSNKSEPIIANEGKDSVKQMVEQKPLHKEHETTPQQKESELLASLTGPTFEPDPYYEEWINDNVRTGNILIDKVLLPKNNDKISDQDVLFKWLMKENIPINLVIMNNDDDLIFSTKVYSENFPEYSFLLNPKELKKSGLYYWRIEDEIEVLYLGKFYFLKKQ